MLITPANFEGVRRTDYVEERIKTAELGEQVYQYPRNALSANERTAQEIGAEIGAILGDSGKAVLQTEIRLPSGMHAVGIAFEKHEDSSVKATYMDSTGNGLPKTLTPFVKSVVNGAGLTGKTTLQTSIAVQQHEGQPNTCLLWLTKNTCDILKTGQLAAPKSNDEADTLISKELKAYLTHEASATVDPNAGFDDYMRHLT